MELAVLLGIIAIILSIYLGWYIPKKNNKEKIVYLLDEMCFLTGRIMPFINKKNKEVEIKSKTEFQKMIIENDFHNKFLLLAQSLNNSNIRENNILHYNFLNKRCDILKGEIETLYMFNNFIPFKKRNKIKARNWRQKQETKILIEKYNIKKEDINFFTKEQEDKYYTNEKDK